MHGQLVHSVLLVIVYLMIPLNTFMCIWMNIHQWLRDALHPYIGQKCLLLQVGLVSLVDRASYQVMGSSNPSWERWSLSWKHHSKVGCHVPTPHTWCASVAGWLR